MINFFVKKSLNFYFFTAVFRNNQNFNKGMLLANELYKNHSSDKYFLVNRRIIHLKPSIDFVHYVRIIPVDYDHGRRVCLRLELYGYEMEEIEKKEEDIVEKIRRSIFQGDNGNSLVLLIMSCFALLVAIRDSNDYLRNPPGMLPAPAGFKPGRHGA